MTRKRFIKLLMAKGMDIRMAEQIAYDVRIVYKSYKIGWDKWASKIVILCQGKEGVLFASS